MNKLKIKFIILTCLLLILPDTQVLSQKQSLYRFIFNKSKKPASVAFGTLVNEFLSRTKYDIKFNILSLPDLQLGINHDFLTEIYVDHPRVYHINNVADSYIPKKKMILVNKYFFPNN